MPVKKYTVLVLIILFICCSCKNGVDKTNETNQDNYQYTNELIDETSPYLLQHAHNPVDWKAWSDKPFELAKAQNKLIILSIGYSSCHWCHVMEEESFEDDDIADLMNKGFVNIKVDREERPDVDIVYQTALELVKGSGGWPLNAIILPNGKPVYLGTYHDKISWKNVISKFQTEYESNPEKIQEYATLLTEGVQDVYDITDKTTTAIVTEQLISQSVLNWSKTWDSEWGGDVRDQKFIMPSQLNFLLDYAILSNDTSVKKHVQTTLDKIALGGINDHIGGGFFRYSTDSQWKVPHFEKMLYDNAQIISLYSKAYRAFKNPEYEEVVKRTITFLKREMTGSNGGYFSAIDADSEGEEGKFYLWGIDELKSNLKNDFELFSKFYGINKGQELENKKYNLTKAYENQQFAKDNSISVTDLEKKNFQWQAVLLEVRNQRIHPKKDDKIITSWNALLVEGLVESYKAFGDKNYLNEAVSVYSFLMNHNYKNETLVHSYKKDSKQKEVFLEDYAHLISASLSLYKVTLEVKYLNTAKNLNKKVLTQFTDASGLFKYSATSELITKIIKTADGVIPSSNAVMAQNLFEIGHVDYNTSYLKQAKNMTSINSTEFIAAPQNYGKWGGLLLNQVYPYFEIVTVGSDAIELTAELNTNYIPNSLQIGSLTEAASPLFKDRFSKDATFIYVCQNSVCKLPVKTTKDALIQIKSFKVAPAAN